MPKTDEDREDKDVEDARDDGGCGQDRLFSSTNKAARYGSLNCFQKSKNTREWGVRRCSKRPCCFPWERTSSTFLVHCLLLHPWDQRTIQTVVAKGIHQSPKTGLSNKQIVIVAFFDNEGPIYQSPRGRQSMQGTLWVSWRSSWSSSRGRGQSRPARIGGCTWTMRLAFAMAFNKWVDRWDKDLGWLLRNLSKSN